MHPINRVASVTLLSRVITYFVVRIYGYVVTEDHYHEECRVHLRFQLLVQPETGTNKNLII